MSILIYENMIELSISHVALMRCLAGTRDRQVHYMNLLVLMWHFSAEQLGLNSTYLYAGILTRIEMSAYAGILTRIEMSAYAGKLTKIRMLNFGNSVFGLCFCEMKCWSAVKALFALASCWLIYKTNYWSYSRSIQSTAWKIAETLAAWDNWSLLTMTTIPNGPILCLATSF